MIRCFADLDWEQAAQLSKPIYYPDLWEPTEAFIIRLKLFPQGCLAAEVDGKLAGYAFSHPWVSDKIVNLGQVIGPIANPDCYYIHDVCVGKQYQGLGVGRALVYKIFEINTFPAIKLVSVLGSHPFWSKMGFHIVEEIKYTNKINGYIMEKLIPKS